MKTLSKQKSGKPVLTVAAMILATLLAKVLGMVRSMLLASHYGTGEAASAFSAASRIPLSFFDLLFSAAILGCFIPVYNGFREDKKGAARFACSFLSLSLTATGLFTILGILAAKPLIALIAPGLSPETAALAVRLLRILFPLVIFTGSTYTLVGILQSDGRFLLPALLSSVSNAGVILYFLLLDDRLGESRIYGLTLAYLFSWLLQLLFLAVPLLRDGHRFRFRLSLREEATRRALRMSLPIMIGSWLTPVSLLSGTFFSSFALPGGNVIFEYGVNLFTMVAGILTYSICNYVFPSLSRLSDAGDRQDFLAVCRSGLLSSLTLVLPFTCALAVLAEEGVSILYRRGSFTPEDAVLTGGVLTVLAFAMPAFAVNEIFSRIYYARSLPRIPMLAALVGAATNLLSGTVFLFALPPSLSLVALSYGLGLFSSATVLLLASRRTLPGLFSRTLLLSVGKLLLASLAGGVCMLLLRLRFGTDASHAGLWRNLLTAIVSALPGLGLYALLLKLLRLRFTSLDDSAQKGNGSR